MAVKTAPLSINRKYLLDIVPFFAVVIAWYVAPHVWEIPGYKLPSPAKVTETFLKMFADGTLWTQVGGSLVRLMLGFVIGNALAIPLGLMMP